MEDDSQVQSINECHELTILEKTLRMTISNRRGLAAAHEVDAICYFDVDGQLKSLHGLLNPLKRGDVIVILDVALLDAYSEGSIWSWDEEYEQQRCIAQLKIIVARHPDGSIEYREASHRPLYDAATYYYTSQMGSSHERIIFKVEAFCDDEDGSFIISRGKNVAIDSLQAKLSGSAA